MPTFPSNSSSRIPKQGSSRSPTELLPVSQLPTASLGWGRILLQPDGGFSWTPPLCHHPRINYARSRRGKQWDCVGLPYLLLLKMGLGGKASVWSQEYKKTWMVVKMSQPVGRVERWAGLLQVSSCWCERAGLDLSNSCTRQGSVSVILKAQGSVTHKCEVFYRRRMEAPCRIFSLPEWFLGTKEIVGCSILKWVRRIWMGLVPLRLVLSLPQKEAWTPESKR